MSGRAYRGGDRARHRCVPGLDGLEGRLLLSDAEPNNDFQTAYVSDLTPTSPGTLVVSGQLQPSQGDSFDVYRFNTGKNAIMSVALETPESLPPVPNSLDPVYRVSLHGVFDNQLPYAAQPLKLVEGRGRLQIDTTSGLMDERIHYVIVGQRDGWALASMPYTLTITTGPRRDPDVVATALAWDEGGAEVRLEYRVDTLDLTADAWAAFYWASGQTLDTVLGPAGFALHVERLERRVGRYGPIEVPASRLGTPPAGANYLLVVLDAPGPGRPIGAIVEASEANNVLALEIPRAVPVNIGLESAAISQGMVGYSYRIAGDSGPFAVALYQSSDRTFDASDRFLTGQTIRPQAGTAGSGFLPLSGYEADPARPFLLVVADPPAAGSPRGAVTEADEADNSYALEAPAATPDLVPRSLGRTALADAERGVLQFSYEVTGGALPGADVPVALYWAKGNTFDARLGGPIYPVDAAGQLVPFATAGVGRKGPFFVPASQLLRNPKEATHILLVVDPPSPGRPDGKIREAGEGSRNVLAVKLDTLTTASPVVKTAGQAAFRLDAGQFTFDVEGTEGGKYHSRRPHLPPAPSGVTIGRGYDLGQQASAAQVKKDLAGAGVPDAVAAELAKGFTKARKVASEFVATHRLLEITPAQQKALFRVTYKRLADDVQRISTNASKTYGNVLWNMLDARLRDLLVDLRYRGDYTPTSRTEVQPPVTDKAGKKDGKGDRVAFRKALANKAIFPSNLPDVRYKQRLAFLDGKDYLAVK